ncbi:MAG TPA: ADP-ribosylglycohydrolase family protein [Longimicrobiaceae bacterium]
MSAGPSDPQSPDTADRYLGSLMGLAVGDAVGAAVEFQPPGSFTPLTDMVGGGPFKLRPGEWTDDTSMALCLAESLIERRGFHPHDQLTRYLRWYRTGHLSSTGRCFDIGVTVGLALRRFESTGAAYCGSTDPSTAGNGSLMRLAPVPLFYSREPWAAIEWSGESSRTTHAAQAAVDACRYFGALLAGAVSGASKEEILGTMYAPLGGYWESHPLAPEVEEVARGSFRHREPPQIVGSGYVVRSLEAALWAFHTTDTFAAGCLRAANLGNDADTTAAVYGQLAGAFYGVRRIPSAWREQIAMRDLIERYATSLYQLSRLDRP